MKVLVTGANGFVGRHVCATLGARDYVVRALVRPGARVATIERSGIEIVHGDVTVPESLARAIDGVDAVVHLAGVTRASRDSTFVRVNVDGTRHLADACRGRGVRRLVFMSALAAQGPSAKGTPHVHPGCEAPIDAYGRSKLAAERLLADRGADVPTTVLRPALLYGPGARAVLELARVVRRRIAPSVPGMELSLLHVDDLAQATLDVLERPDAPFGPYFLSDGAPVALEALVARLERLVAPASVLRIPVARALANALAPAAERFVALTGFGLGVARAVREMGGASWTCMPDEARRDLGFEPQVDLDTGLAETIAWFRAEGLLRG